MSEHAELELLGLTDIIRLRERLNETLNRRFTRTVAVAAVAGAGADAPSQLVAAGGTLADGGATAVAVFSTVDAAVDALVELLRREPTAVAGLTWGPVLSDGGLVAGEGAEQAARLCDATASGELRVTRSAYVELSSRYRLRCLQLPATGGRPAEYLLAWRPTAEAPAYVRIDETGELVPLPDGSVIVFGRQREGNDVILSLPSKDLLRISRVRHFEVRRELDELYFYSQSDQPALVDGQPVAKGERARLNHGTVVRLAGVMTLVFIADPAAGNADETAMQTMAVTPNLLKP